MAFPRTYLPPDAVPLNRDPVSVEEYERRERVAEFKSEFYDGFIYPLWPEDGPDAPVGMAGGSPAHMVLSARLVRRVALSGDRQGCEVLGSEVRVQALGSDRYVYPDALVACGPRWSDGPVKTLANPLVIFEVLSPSTELRERTTKFELYAAHPTVEAIVLVASGRRMVEVFVRQSATAWLREALSEGVLVVAGGVAVDLAELYRDVPGLG